MTQVIIKQLQFPTTSKGLLSQIEEIRKCFFIEENTLFVGFLDGPRGRKRIEDIKCGLNMKEIKHFVNVSGKWISSNS